MLKIIGQSVKNVVQKKRNNNIWAFPDDYNFMLPLSTKVNHNAMLVFEKYNDDNLQLTWVELDQHTYITSLSSMIDNQIQTNTIL